MLYPPQKISSSMVQMSQMRLPRPHHLNKDSAYAPIRLSTIGGLTRDPIPPGTVIPVLSMMQGHPESQWLWKKHADKILHKIGLTPTIHKPCLYSGLIEGQRVIFLCQVDDFAIACSNESTANKLLDMLNDKLTIPLKRMY
jgi:hypothetical protein